MLPLPPLNLSFTSPANATSGQDLQGAAWAMNSPFVVNVPGSSPASPFSGAALGAPTAAFGLPMWALIGLAMGGAWLLYRRR